jgi:hypothetical protein
MIERAIAKAPSFAAIEWAARDCIDTLKFMPVTAEIFELIASTLNFSLACREQQPPSLISTHRISEVEVRAAPGVLAAWPPR